MTQLCLSPPIRVENKNIYFIQVFDDGQKFYLYSFFVPLFPGIVTHRIFKRAETRGEEARNDISALEKRPPGTVKSRAEKSQQINRPRPYKMGSGFNREAPPHTPEKNNYSKRFHV